MIQKTPLKAAFFIPVDNSQKHTLFYVHDPMCSWCWGFRPALTTLLKSLPADIEIKRLLGGLARDTDIPMPLDMQQGLEDTWRRIQERIPGTPFNFDFWRNCEPRRSTYPACRAVIAARTLAPDREESMIVAIQKAYYTDALNPSDASTLVWLAENIGLDAQAFGRLLQASATDRVLQDEIALARTLGAESFPSLVLQSGAHRRWHIPIFYDSANRMLDRIRELVSQRIS